MKKQITFFRTGLLVAVMLWGVLGQSMATVTITVSSSTEVTGSNYNTIQAAYNYVKALPSLTEPYDIELQSSYDPTTAPTLEFFPIIFTGNSASGTNNITIRPATNAKITLAVPNQTVIASNLSISANASASTTIDLTGKITVGDISMINSNSYIAGLGTYVGGVFKKVTSVSGNEVTVPTGTFASTKSGVTLYFGNAQTKVFYFNGGDYITIDGVSRTDATQGLTIQNPNCIYAQAILFDNTSTYNTIRECIVRGANQTGAWNNGYQGTVYFAGGTNNTIENNDVCDMNDSNIPLPICHFQMTAAGGTNNTNTIQNNNIYNISNYYSGNGTFTFMQFGTATSANNAILNNRFFWTSPQTFSVASNNFFNCGTLSAGNRFEGNIVGYSSADGTGTADLTYTGSGGTITASPNAKYFTSKNNTISNIKITGTTGAKALVSMQIVPTGTASADNCYGNTIQNIELNSNGGNGTLYGIFVSATPTYNLDIKNNVIKNLKCQSTGASYTNTVYGLMHNFGASGTIAINCIGNEIANLTAGSSGTYNSSAANSIAAFYSGGCSNIYEKNLVYNLNTISTGTGSLIKGMRFNTSKVDGVTIKNNVFRLGTDVTSDVTISAIANEGLSNNSHPFNIYNNTIYISGSSQTMPSHCLNRSSTATSGLISIQNNIFSNKRSGGTAVNQIYNLYAAADVTTSDHNLYEYGSKFGTVTTTSPTTYTAMSDWVTAKSPTVVETGSINQTSPQFMDATATIPDLRIIANSAVVDQVGADLSATVTDDYDGKTRSSFTAHDLGAFAYTKVALASDASLASHRFRTQASGDWRTNATWESSADGTSWITATAFPSATANSIVIQNGHTVTASAEATASTLTIDGGGKLTLSDRVGLTASTLNLESHGTNGTATFVDGNATGGLTVSSTTTVKQNLTTGRNWYISNPVVATTLPTVASGTRTLYGYNEANVNEPTGSSGWVANPASVEVGTGYVASVSVTGDLTFAGALNTGNKNITLTSRTGTANKAGFNLIGNPYPSYLDWDAVMAANTDKLRSSTMWYRTKINDEYSFWTVNGDGVGVPNGASVKIPPMQSFWVRANEGGSTLNLTNNMRSHAPVTDKLLKAPSAKNADRTLVRLQVSNGKNSDEAVIYFSEKAKNGYDINDAPKMSNGNAAIPEIFTSLDNEKIVINCMNSMPLDQEIGLGFVAGNATSFSIKANEISNIPAGVRVILKDNANMSETDLTDGTATYDFSPATTVAERFSIIFRSPSSPTGFENVNKPSVQVFVNAVNQITIIAPEKSNYAIYNAMGQLMDNGKLNAELQTVKCKLQTGIYVVKVGNQSNRVIIK